MKRELAKKLLENGVLQAYASGEVIQTKDPDLDGWEDWTKDEELNFDSPDLFYRVKPKPVPHDFLSACKAIGEHGTELVAQDGTEFLIRRVCQASCDIQRIDHAIGDSHWFESMMSYHFPDGTPFHKEIE